jgi:transcriptional regulator with XRE-family HTH domain
MTIFGPRLKAFRDARGWSQERVGFELGVTKATISKWETGRAEPGLGNLALIRRLFEADGATLDFLVDETVESSPDGKRVGEAMAARYGANVIESNDIRALVARYKKLSSSQRKGLLDLLGGDL